jgi:hypothetical protein
MYAKPRHGRLADSAYIDVQIVDNIDNVDQISKHGGRRFGLEEEAPQVAQEASGGLEGKSIDPGLEEGLSKPARARQGLVPWQVWLSCVLGGLEGIENMCSARWWFFGIYGLTIGRASGPPLGKGPAVIGSRCTKYIPGDLIWLYGG